MLRLRRMLLDLLPDLSKINETWKSISDLLSQIHAPEPVRSLLASVFLLLIAIVLISALIGFVLSLVQQCKKLWTEVIQPLLYTPEQKFQLRQRKIFARHLELELERLDNEEEWSDQHFTDLEAEVEAEGPTDRKEACQN